jgi:hypothetical protein
MIRSSPSAGLDRARDLQLELLDLQGLGQKPGLGGRQFRFARLRFGNLRGNDLMQGGDVVGKAAMSLGKRAGSKPGDPKTRMPPP